MRVLNATYANGSHMIHSTPALRWTTLMFAACTPTSNGAVKFHSHVHRCNFLGIPVIIERHIIGLFIGWCVANLGICNAVQQSGGVPTPRQVFPNIKAEHDPKHRCAPPLTRKHI